MYRAAHVRESHFFYKLIVQCVVFQFLPTQQLLIALWSPLFIGKEYTFRVLIIFTLTAVYKWQAKFK